MTFHSYSKEKSEIGALDKTISSTYTQRSLLTPAQFAVKQEVMGTSPSTTTNNYALGFPPVPDTTAPQHKMTVGESQKKLNCKGVQFYLEIPLCSPHAMLAAALAEPGCHKNIHIKKILSQA